MERRQIAVLVGATLAGPGEPAAAFDVPTAAIHETAAATSTPAPATPAPAAPAPTPVTGRGED